MDRILPAADHDDTGDDMDQQDRTDKPKASPRARLSMRAWETQTAAARRAEQDRTAD